jgi:hypothetical protein
VLGQWCKDLFLLVFGPGAVFRGQFFICKPQSV